MPSEKIPVGTPQIETHKKFEDFLSHEIPRQHEACTTSLRKTGLLEEMFADQDDGLVVKIREGITAMDGKKFELPSPEKIAKHFSAEKYREKFEQGFTKLLIVPFGYPLETLKIRYAEQILKHHKEGKLLDRDNNALKLDQNRPFYVPDEFNKSDETDGLIYYPKQFDKNNHGGKTKQQLLDDKSQPFPRFHVFLIKPDLTIPRYGSGKTVGTRKDFETYKSPIDYLKLLTQPQYREEQGFTLEDSIVLAMTHLDQTNQVIDDWQNDKDSINLNVGNYHIASRGVPLSCWHRGYSQARVKCDGPGYADSEYGVRMAVG